MLSLKHSLMNESKKGAVLAQPRCVTKVTHKLGEVSVIARSNCCTPASMPMIRSSIANSLLYSKQNLLGQRMHHAVSVQP